MRQAARGCTVAVLSAGLCALLPATAAAVCQLNPVVGLHFVNYLSTSTQPLDTQGSVSYRCEGHFTPITIDLSAGGASSALSRRMVGPSSSTLSYNLYLDAARTLIWGNGLSGTSRYGPVLPVNSVDVVVPVHGRIPAGQTIPAGSYSDTVVVTFTF
ncbi:spore coat U domain-containing protein [Myxococcus stipitatus]|uniref:Csu type fimbrial protein n=1 Tax=Myxococcus stipitatus TaxID=83455 RepID=UPI001F30CC93|nr:spore coat U domain-containing protein [Myxococcus stipitatus]MCE9667182.1 spore coat U domain-containing protein [Myxococcus stipitatus]